MKNHDRLATLIFIAGIIEFVALVAMLTNLATVDSRAFAAVAAPTHGLTWAFIVIACILHPKLSRRQRALAIIPGIGGLIAARSMRRAG